MGCPVQLVWRGSALPPTSNPVNQTSDWRMVEVG